MHEETLIKFSRGFQISRVKIACFENEGAALVWLLFGPAKEALEGECKSLCLRLPRVAANCLSPTLGCSAVP